MSQPPGPPGFGPPQDPPPGAGHPSWAPRVAPEENPYLTGGPTNPPGTPGGGGRGSRTAILVIAALAVFALLAGGGAGAWYLTSSGDDGKDAGASAQDDAKDRPAEPKRRGSLEKVPAEPEADILMRVAAPKLKGDDGVRTIGSWLSEKTYAKSGRGTVVGYDLTGAEKWTLTLPGETCAAAREVATAGTAVVAHAARKPGKKDEGFVPCTDLTAFSLDSGKRLWTAAFGNEKNYRTVNNMAVSGGTVAVTSADGSIAYDTGSGKVRWSKPREETSCYDQGYKGGPRLLAVRTCPGEVAPTFQVQRLDPVNGDADWSYKLPEGVEKVSPLSTSPVVFAADNGKLRSTGEGDIFSLTDQGKVRYKLSLEAGRYAFECEIIDMARCRGVVVGNDEVYLATNDHESGGGSGDSTNEVVSFSLADGKSTGARTDAGAGNRLVPLRMDGSNVLAWKDTADGPAVVTIDSVSMKQTELLRAPQGEEDIQELFYPSTVETAEIHYRGGRLFFSQVLLTAPSEGEKPSPVAVGFAAE